MICRFRLATLFAHFALVSCAFVCAMSAASVLRATPYASHVTMSGTTVDFILNQPTQSLTYSINGGAPLALDGSTKGTKSFNLGSPTDHFSIVAANNDTTGFLISTGGTIAAVVGTGISQ